MPKKKETPKNDCSAKGFDINHLCSRASWQQFQNPMEGKSVHISLNGKFTYLDPSSKERVSLDIGSVNDEIISALEKKDKIYYGFMAEIFKNKQTIIVL